MRNTPGINGGMLGTAIHFTLERLFKLVGNIDLSFEVLTLLVLNTNL